MKTNINKIILQPKQDNILQTDDEIIQETMDEYLKDMGRKVIPKHPAFTNPVFPARGVYSIGQKIIDKIRQSEQEENGVSFIAVGNGEKCPFCDKILDDRIKKGMIEKHLFDKHPKEMKERLFPEQKEKEVKNEKRQTNN